MIQPDVELIMMALLDDLGYTDTALPAEPWDDIYPMIILNRLPAGGITPDLLTDRALVAMLVIGEDRHSAQAAARDITARILNDALPQDIDVDGRNWQIEVTEQISGVATEPDINPDNRFIEASFWVPISLRF